MEIQFQNNGINYQLIVSVGALRRSDPEIKPDKSIISKNEQRYIPKRED